MLGIPLFILGYNRVKGKVKGGMEMDAGFGEKIIAIRRDENGDIQMVKNHTGRVLSIEQAMEEAKEGRFDSLNAIDKEGNWFINSSAGDGMPERGGNLDILPEF